jgi:hypothetical protein
MSAQLTLQRRLPDCDLAMTSILKFYDNATCAGFIL